MQLTEEQMEQQLRAMATARENAMRSQRMLSVTQPVQAKEEPVSTIPTAPDEQPEELGFTIGEPKTRVNLYGEEVPIERKGDVDFVGAATKSFKPIMDPIEKIEKEEEPYTVGGISGMFIKEFRDDRIQKEVIDKLPEDNAFKTFGNVVGPKVFRNSMNLLHGFFKGIGYTADGIEAGMIYLRDKHPNYYDLLQASVVDRVAGGKMGPAETAQKIVKDFLMLSESLDFPIAGVPLLAAKAMPAYTKPTKVELFQPTDKSAGPMLPATDEERLVGLDMDAGFKTTIRTYDPVKKEFKDEVVDIRGTEKAQAIREDPTKLSVMTAREARQMESEVMSEIEARNRKIAEANVGVRNDLIKSFEEQVGVKISKVDSKGNLQIDMDLVKSSGQAIADKKAGILDKADPNFIPAFEPLLQPDKLNGLIALATDFKKRFPDNFKAKKKGDKGNLLDQITEVVIATDKDGNRLVSDPELLSTLSKYGLSFEEFILTATSTASQAGKILQKFGTIVGRNKAAQTDKDFNADKLLRENINFYGNLLIRVEGIRRGILVAALKTAFRNAEAHIIARSPMEVLGNVLDGAMYTAADKGFKLGMKELLPGSTSWKDSLKQTAWIFSNQTDAKDTLEYIYKRPQLMDKYNRMFEIFSDIQEAKRGNIPQGNNILAQTARRADQVLEVFEDSVQWANIPNRLQEFTIRRASVLAELQRQVRLEYGIDLFTTLREGKIQQLLNNDPSLVPEGKPGFLELTERATMKGLSDTYAKQPEVKVFRQFTNFLVNYGLTAFTTAFPRFLFNKAELIGQYMLGSSIPATKRMYYLLNYEFGGVRSATSTTSKIVKSVTSKKTKAQIKKEVDEIMNVDFEAAFKAPLNAKDRERISRNMVGVSAIGAGYGLISLNDEELPNEPDTARVLNYDVNLGPLSPIPDLALASRIAYELFEGDLADFVANRDGYKNAVKILAGAEAGRNYWGSVSPFVEHIVGITQGVAGRNIDPENIKLTPNQMVALEKAFTNYYMSFGQYFQQFYQADVAFGNRPVGSLDTSYDIIPGELDSDGEPISNFKRERMRYLKARYPDPFDLYEAMKADPTVPTMTNPRMRVSLFGEDTKTKLTEGLNVTFGLNIKKTTPMGRFFRKYGIYDFKISKFSNTPSVARAQKALLKNYMSGIYENALAMEKEYEKEWLSLPKKEREIIRLRTGYITKEGERAFGKKEYVRDKMRTFIGRLIKVKKGVVSNLTKQRLENPVNEEVRYIAAYNAYKKTGSKADKEDAQLEFYRDTGERADLTDVADLRYIVDLIKQKQSIIRKQITEESELVIEKRQKQIMKKMR